MSKLDKKTSVYIVSAYKSSSEPYAPDEKIVLGYCRTEKESKEVVERLKEKYIPKYLKNRSSLGYIENCFKWNFDAWLKSDQRKNCYPDASDEELREDFKKWHQRRAHLKYDGFDYEELEAMKEKEGKV